MSLLNVFKKKKVTDFTRVELEKIATANKVGFTKDTTDEELTEALEFAIAELKDAEKASGKKLKIKFLLSPTGKYNLGYNAGDVAELEEKQALEIVEDKYAELVK